MERQNGKEIERGIIRDGFYCKEEIHGYVGV